MNKKMEDRNIIELKATLFDIEQEIKYKQNVYNQVAQLLQTKSQQEDKTETNKPIENKPKKK